MSTDYTAEAKRIRARHTALANDINNRRDLSADGRKRQLARLQVDAKRELRALREQAAAANAARRDQIMDRLFRNPDSYDSSAVISYRDALERADRVNNPTEAASLLKLAQRTGDAALARAVAAKALDAAMSDRNGGDGWVNVVNAWGAEDNGRDELLTELSEITAVDAPTSRLQDSFQFAVHAPRGLSRDDDVDQLAAAADPAEATAPDPRDAFPWKNGDLPEAS